MFPTVIRNLSKILVKDIICTAIIINNIFFVLNSLLLYLITEQRYGCDIAEYTYQFFILNPANIIFSSLYTEPLYMFVFLTGFYLIERNKKFFASIFFMISALTRSNGIMNILFLIDIFSLKSFIYSTLYVSIVSSPFIYKQYQDFYILKLKNFILPYSFIQAKYWEHGFFKFYTYKKNFPNFIIGIPFILYSLYIIASYIKTKFFIKNKFTLNNFKILKEYNTRVLVLLLAIQTFLCIFFIHMQMFFRFVSYNPFWYWSMSFLYTERSKFFTLLVYAYIFYGIAYSILFGAYYPPA
ncbi:hypothetical protein GVAV_001357 [Gurleya vavrai]